MKKAPLDLATILKLIRIMRVHIIVGGGLAFSLGALLALLDGGSWTPTRIILGYLVVFLGDLSTHYSNDYFDVDVDKYLQGEPSKYFTGSRILVDYPKLRPFSRSIAIASMAFSTILGGVAVLFSSAPTEFLVLTIGANLVGWFYSAPPLRLTTRGLGEIAVAIVTGSIIPGAGYLMVKGRFDPLFIYFTIPFTMYGFMLILSLEVPDIEIDRKGGKRNLAVRKGQHFINSAILVLSSSATLTFLIYALTFHSIIDFRSLTLFSMIPLTAGLYGFLKAFFKGEDGNRSSTRNIVSLFIINILLIAYFLSLLL